MKIKVIAILCLLFGSLLGLPDSSLGQNVRRPPEKVAQALVDAFNARDIEAILKTYSPDSVAYRLPGGEAFITGHAEIRKKFNSAFERDTTVKVKVVERIVDGKFVVDKEKITGVANGKKYERYSTVIYEITNGVIRKEWYFKQ